MSGFETEFDGSVVGSNLDATTPESTRAVQDLGFGNHGLVIRSPEGDVLFKQKDHEVKLEEVRAKLRELTSS